MSFLKLIKNNIAEIRDDLALTYYGAALSFSYFLSAIFLFKGDHYAQMISKEVEPICWPFFESCYKYRWLSNFEIRVSLLVFGALSLLPFLAFLRKKVTLGYWSLAFVAILHGFLFIQDFRNTQNQYYMLFWCVFAYLFWPGKRSALQYLILSFYFWAGRMKLNSQWLSGHNLYEKLWFIPVELNAAACIYVVVLEMLLIWGLVSKNKIWFYATAVQLTLFHIISASQIGFFYPEIMFSILSIYLLCRFFPSGTKIRLTNPTTWPLILLFAFFQIYPSLVSKDRAFSGVGRTFALNMFEANFDCKVSWREHYKDGHAREVDAREKNTRRLECEPIYYYSKTKNECRKLASDPTFTDLDLHMEVSRIGEPLQPLIERSSFCNDPPVFNLFFPNSWINR